MNCPNCGRSNPAEAAYCHKCGFRLPTAAARGAGVAYRRAEQTEPHGGGGQGLLAFGAVLLAGMLFAVGAVALFLSGPPAATPTGVAAITPEPTLPIFVQPTASPSPEPAPTVAPSVLGSPSLLPSLPIETPIIGPTPTPTSVLPTPTPRPPTPTPPPPTPTPGATPPNCSAADGSDMRSITIGYGNPSSRVTPRAWCIHEVIIRPFIDNGADTPSNGEPGRTRLLEDGDRIAQTTCTAESCNDFTKSFPPRFVPADSNLEYQFVCQDNPNTPETNECTDDVPGGATIEINYEPVPGT